jgi:hypothetical protein
VGTIKKQPALYETDFIKIFARLKVPFDQKSGFKDNEIKKYKPSSSNGNLILPYIRCKLYTNISFPTGIARNNFPPFLSRHLNFCISLMSPKGSKGSPYRPNPECSMLEKEIIKSE